MVDCVTDYNKFEYKLPFTAPPLKLDPNALSPVKKTPEKAQTLVSASPASTVDDETLSPSTVSEDHDEEVKVMKVNKSVS